jgi:methionyl-tRNA synthetase
MTDNTTNNSRKILVTSALPYANGAIHLGHLVEYIQTDTWVRFQRMRGHTCFYICGNDAHGTPVMLTAAQQNVAPEDLVTRVHKEHETDFAAFGISFDSFYTTHSPENKYYSELIYERLKKRGDISSRTIRQAYDPIKNMFLPDRYVKGECPRCQAKGQYGDSCEVCGATYSPLELINPISVVSGATPIEKESEHFFFELPHYHDFLLDWTAKHTQKQVSNKLSEWFEQGLRAWDITRDAPYFGFEIPGVKDKYFYVWLDAPIGYMASFKKLCESRKDLRFDDFWGIDSKSELYHFVGKDIIYFHALFWPAMLEGAGFRKPTAIFSHGFLTIDGEKMSKSRGTFINARTYLKHLNPEYLRYYFAAKLNNGIDDIDLNLDDFMQRVNSDLVGKVINIASRCASFISNYFEGMLANNLLAAPNADLFNHFVQAGDKIAEYFEDREFNRATRDVMELADRANQYIDEQKPWALIKSPENKSQVQAVCTLGLNLFKVLMTYLKPILPSTAKEVEHFFNIDNNPMTWKNRSELFINRKINPFKPLLQRIDKKSIEAMKDSAKETIPSNNTLITPSASSTEVAATAKPTTEQNTQINHAIASGWAPILPEISYDDFAKIDLRIAKIVKAEHVPDADKLLKLIVDIGNGQTRQIFAGIKAGYQPDQLEGKQVVIVANLAPRKMRFGMSEGMIIVASEENEGSKVLKIICPEDGATPGMRVK